MKHAVRILVLFFIILSLSCARKEITALDQVLVMAGKNRVELEKVLKHYGINPADSLKRKAAEFLILNMPGKYSESYDAPWEDIASVNMRWSSSSDKLNVLETYKLGNKYIREDLQHITAAFLISNIELAFQSWQDKPWGKHIPFDTFCEEILPYRIGAEPLENWRERVLASFADVNNSLKEDSTMTAVKACSKVNALLPRFRNDKDFSEMSFTQLMATTRGMCDSQAAFAAFVMRALGIPVTIDFTPHWKSIGSGHSWNSVCDSAGQHISFMGADTDPFAPHQGNTYMKGKAYRRTFGYNRIAETDDKYLPPLFRNNLLDISSEHDSMVVATVHIKPHTIIANQSVFLAQFFDYEWRITGHGEMVADSVRFGFIGKDVLYLPVYYTNEILDPAGDPFYIDPEGRTHILSADNPDTLMLFRSIKPENDISWDWRMVNAVFESSDSADFSNPQPIHKIVKTPVLYNTVTLRKPYTCRYIRYKSPVGNCNVSEISFYDTSGKKMEGENIGLPGSWDDLGNTCDKAFDGDISTFYDAVETEGSWTGLDFGENKTIASIRYSPRTHGIGIYDGHEYEMFCWTDKAWKSLEKKMAFGQAVEFSVPSNALLYVYNRTLKKKGQIFFILGDKIHYYS